MSFINRILRTLTKDYLSDGLSYFENCDYASAVAEFEKVISRDPDPSSQDHKLAKFYITEAYIALGDDAMKLGERDRAKHYYQKVADFNDYADVYLKIARLYYQDADYASAEEYVLKALKASNKYLKAKLFLCIIGLKQNKIEETVDYLIELVFVSLYENLEELEKAIDTVREGDIDNAIRLLENITIDKPREWVLFVKQGDSHWVEGDLELALESYNKAIGLKAEYPDYHYKKGQVLLELGRYEEAAESFSNAIRINPDYIRARTSLGAVYVMKNDFDNARKQFNMVLNIDPENEEALINLKELLKK